MNNMFSKIKETELLMKVRIHTFGSVENYKLYKSEKKKMPLQYATIVSCIIKGLFPEDVILCMIENSHKAYKPETSHERKSVDGDGSKGKRVSVGEKIITDLTEHVAGSRAAGSAWDPLEHKTYVQRVSSNRSHLRAANYSETEVDMFTVKYTKKYNEIFGTSFEPYYSKKRIKKEKTNANS